MCVTLSCDSHPKYDEYYTLNDIAIIKLKNKIEFNSFIQPACLPTNDHQTSNTEVDAWAAGWGKLNFNGAPSETLQNVKLKIYDKSRCSQVSSKNDWRTQICAGEYNGGKDTCQGDSGGPLYVKDTIAGKEKFVVVGITSYGIGCAEKGYPGLKKF
ncbi:CLIPD1 [Brachionus plicatilis]|uniref:CLIPD1 n=1 Tax=Brachionus plicatilis TaxID=10195 RepID=A0A3M7QBP8_BRAPC|nr:CLIPD1 [Brachionus plicatilis]